MEARNAGLHYHPPTLHRAANHQLRASGPFRPFKPLKPLYLSDLSTFQTSPAFHLSNLSTFQTFPPLHLSNLSTSPPAYAASRGQPPTSTGRPACAPLALPAPSFSGQARLRSPRATSAKLQRAGLSNLSTFLPFKPFHLSPQSPTFAT